MMPKPMGSDRITGATRYRSGWFGKLILQVEENVTFYRPASACNPSKIVSTKWRDATVRDLRLIDWHEREARSPRIMPTTGSGGMKPA